MAEVGISWLAGLAAEPTWDVDNNCFYGLTANYSTSFHAADKGTHDIFTDPLFVNLANRDFHLLRGSPCIDAGVAIAGINDGYIGSAPDIGRYEYIPLTATIDQAVGQSDPTNSTINFTVVFSESVSDFATGTVIASIAADKATGATGNTNEVSTSTDNTVTYDITEPTVPGTPTTSSATNNTKPTWTWTASTDAGSGLALTPYTVQWCTNSSFTGCSANTDTSSINSFTHSIALDDDTWYFRVEATDAVGNVSDWSANGSFNLITSIPSGSVSINSGASYTNSSSVTLTISATDSVYNSSQLTMKVSNLSDLSDASYESYSTSKTWTLVSPTTDGTKTVYIKFKNLGGNESSIYSASITLDTTAPASFDLDSPGDNSYTNSERPSFKWRATTDATAGLSKYVLEIDNPSIGSNQPNGDFTVDSIPTSRTTDYETNKYTIHYENFSDSDSTNNYISVYTKSFSDWGSSENDGKLREGRVSWKVKAVDNAGNEQSSSRTLFVDRTSPSVAFTQINSTPYTTNNFSTTDKTPTIFGKITDSLSGGDSSQTQDENGPKIASGPKQVDIKVEKKEGLTYKLVTLYKINMDNPYYTCDSGKTIDNSKQKCDKYLPFEYTPKENLGLGIYKITLSGKDKADNTSSETSLTLNITTLAQITTPEEKEIIEKEIKELPKEEQEKVKEELEITKPTEAPKPNIFEKTGESIGNIISAIFTGIGTAIKTVFNGIGSGLAFIGNIIGKRYNALVNNAPGVIKNVLLAIGNTVNKVVNGIKNGIANLAFAIGEKTEDFSETAGLVLVKLGYLFVNEPTKIADVQVAILSPTSVKVSWKTNHPANGKVNYGLDETYPLDIQSEKRVTSHEFTLTNLKPDTQYYFEVMSHNKNYVYDANRKFKTPEK